MNLDKWKSQIVRGTLEYCILLMLDKKVYYGYEILQELSKYPIIASTESTVYPLLRRLQKETTCNQLGKSPQRACHLVSIIH